MNQSSGLGYLRQIERLPDEDVTPMECWCLVTVINPDSSTSRHLLGRVYGEGRYSTSLVSIDWKNFRAETKSGRFYQFVGPPGLDDDAQWTLQLTLQARKQVLKRVHLLGIQRLIQSKRLG
jgi:hypothetical protein